MVGSKPAENKLLVPLAAVSVGLAAYFAVFFATRLPSLEERLASAGAGSVVRRIDLVGQILLLPDDWLFSAWFGSPPGFALLDRLPALALAGAVLTASGAAGWLLMRLVRADRGLAPLETFCFAQAVGASAVSTYTLAAGLMGLLPYKTAFWLPAIAVLAGAGWTAWRRGHAPPPTPCAPRPSPLLWLAAPFAAVIVLGAMLPPADFDVREYHLQAPKEWFQQGRVVFLPHNVYGNMPLGAEMFPLAAMALSGDWWLGALAGKTAMAAMTLVCAAGLAAAGARFFSARAGALAAAVYLSTPWIVGVSTAGLNEGVTACYALLAVHAMLLWRADAGEGGRSPVPRLLLAGYLAGAAAATKYPALLFVVLPLAAWAAAAGFRAARRHAWRPVGVFALAALAGCGGWYGKNAALAGNPAYPLLYEAFGGKTWTAEKDAQWNRAHRPRDFSLARLGDDLGKVGWRSEWTGPLAAPLAALGLAAAVGRKGKGWRVMWVLAGLFGYWLAAWWLLTHRIDRFWLPALPLAALLAGAGACWRDDRPWRTVLAVILAVGLASGFVVAAGVPLAGGYNRYFVPLERLRRDPQRVDAWHLWLNANARDGRVLLVGDAEPFDLEMPVLYSTCFDDCLFERMVRGELAPSPFSARGITHVLVRWDHIRRYREPGNYGFTDFVQPEVFDRLVRSGVLERLPPIEDNAGECFRVR